MSGCQLRLRRGCQLKGIPTFFFEKRTGLPLVERQKEKGKREKGLSVIWLHLRCGCRLKGKGVVGYLVTPSVWLSVERKWGIGRPSVAFGVVVG